MKTNHTRLRLFLPALAVALLVPASASVAQDTDLFTNRVPPNVMLMVDNSGSMNNLVWHPSFDPTVNSTCVANFGFDIDNDVTYSFTGNITSTQCGNTRTLYADDTVTGSTRILGRYLNWYFSNEAAGFFKGVGNNDIDNMDSLANGTRSQCLIDEGYASTYSRYRRSRITAAQEVLREVICQVNLAGAVRFGLAQFYSGSEPDGGFVAVPIDDYTSAHATAIDTFIDDLSGETWTPLAETLYNVYRYFQSRTNPALGVDTNPFPAYDFDATGVEVAVASAPVSPLQYDCQKNFIVIITDGEPTKDDFNNMDGSFSDLVGNFNPDDLLPEAGDEEPDDACPFCNDTSLYLDDLAMYMQTADFQRDVAGTQVIDVYTVGFTTGGPANQLLQKTANVGNGLFRQSNNAEELADALIEQIVDILQKTQAFTSATVPASRTTDGDSFYTSYFRPSGLTPFWEGHLKSFKFTATGDILTANDKCAIGDDTLDPPCPTNGNLLTESLAIWDAADRVPNPADRKLKVGFSSIGFGQGASNFFNNASGSISHTQTRTTLALDTAPAADLAKAPFNLPNPNTTADLDALVPQLVSQIAGCQFGTLLGTDCANRQDANGNDVLLGDIFHSTPVIVDSPNSPINSLTYKLFANDYRQRTRVIYAGANDGWLHGIHAGAWDTGLTPNRHDRGTGDELMGFMPSEIREKIWTLPLSQPAGSVREETFVDGPLAAGDVWIYRTVSSGQFTTVLAPFTTTPVKEQWRTVLLGGLRDGGRSYYALDVTDPSDTAYPRFFWEFPCQDCGVAVNPNTDNDVVTGGPDPKQLMGNTWSEPVITRVRVTNDSGVGSFDRWVAVFGAGYDICGDPNNVAYHQQTAGLTCDSSDADKYSRGRAIMMVDITTGELLGIKAFHTSDASVGGGQITYDEMTFAFASQPAVFDTNFDGYADVIYIGDLGGNMWKWVVSNIGDDPINNATGNKSLGQPNWPFELFFQANHSNDELSPPAAWNSSTHFQSFFFPPTATKRGDSLVLAWGAGERADPDAGVDDTPGSPPAGLSNNNHFYVVLDTDPKSTSGTATTLVETDLIDIRDIDSGVKSCSDIAKGFFITGRDREKFISNSVIFLGDIITTSYVPAATGANPCNATGESFFYRFSLDCGDPGFPSNPGTTEDKRRKAIGQGLPTRPRVSVGDLNTGGGGGGCKNKVIVITSDGQIENDCPGSLPTSGVEIRSWRTND